LQDYKVLKRKEEAALNQNFPANNTIIYPERIASALLNVFIKNKKPTKIEITSAKEPKNATNQFNLLAMRTISHLLI
jgi:hypothetical protein